MATINEKLPSFTEGEYSPAKMRQLIMILERWKTSIDIATASSTNGIPAGGSAGEVLTKVTGADYDVDWLPGGGGGASDRIWGFFMSR